MILLQYMSLTCEYRIARPQYPANKVKACSSIVNERKVVFAYLLRIYNKLKIFKKISPYLLKKKSLFVCLSVERHQQL